MNKYFFILLIFSSIFLSSCMNDLNPEGGWSQPIITNDNMVIASKDGYLHKINLDNGFYNPNWKYPRDENLGAIYGSVKLYENIIYGSSYTCRGGDCSGKVFAVNEEDAMPYWGGQYIPVDGRVVGNIAVLDDMLLVALGPKNSELNDSPKGILISIDRKSGFTTWKIPLDGESWSGIYINENKKTAYLGTLNGSIYAIDLEDLSEYSINPESRILWTYNTGRAIAGGLFIDGDSIIFGDFGNRVIKLSTQSRFSGIDFPAKQEWVFETDNWVWAAPIIDEDIIYVSTLSGHVYAIDNVNGNQRWEVELDTKVIGSPVVFDRKRGDVTQKSLAVPSADKNIFSLSLFDGKQTGIFSTDLPIKSSPVLYEDLLYAHTLDGKIFWFSTLDMSLRGCTDLIEGKSC